MFDILFILPDGNGSETSFGKEFRFSCKESDSVKSLFDVIRKRLGQANVRLSIERPSGATMELMAIDPHSDDAVGTIDLAGRRIIVGFQRPN